jgi:exodeoxyribonuclease V
MPSFTPQQDAALTAASTWLKAARGRASIFRLFGYAGTGKTTLAKHLAEGIDGKVLFAAFTGKAACVMRSRGCNGATTIHSLIYKARDNGEETPSFELWHEAPASKAKLIVVDECSMVDAELAHDLMSFRVPLLVLGDPAQLPPIQGGGFFTDAAPDAMLTEVHRQAQDDPIVRLSMMIRAGSTLPQGRYGATEVVRRNATRRAYNARLRQRRGFAGQLPMTGDKLVCLRNNRRKGLFNGGLWMVSEQPRRRRQIIRMRLMPDDALGERTTKVSVLPECFTGAIDHLDWAARKRYDEFDFGYVLTVHKAQGSQWDDVVLFDESSAFSDNRDRWLYTGVTRAAKRLTVVV